MSKDTIIMLHPIQKDHELICRNCGCVLGEVSEQVVEKSLIPPNHNIALLGSAMDNTTKNTFRRTSKAVYDEKLLRNISNLVEKYDLPNRLVDETFKSIKKRNWGVRSETEYIKVLIRILSKDENYIHIKKLQLIKARYEEIINI